MPQRYYNPNNSGYTWIVILILLGLAGAAYVVIKQVCGAKGC